MNAMHMSPAGLEWLAWSVLSIGACLGLLWAGMTYCVGAAIRYPWLVMPRFSMASGEPGGVCAYCARRHVSRALTCLRCGYLLRAPSRRG